MSTKKLTILNNGLLRGEESSSNRDLFKEIFGTWVANKKGFQFKKRRQSKISFDVVQTSAADDESEFYKYKQKIEFAITPTVDLSPASGLGSIANAAEQAQKSLAHKFIKALITKPLPDIAQIDSSKKLLSFGQYEDYAAIARVPITSEEIYNMKKSSGNQTGFAGVDFELLYTDEPYEKILNRPYIKEVEIPSMYEQVTKAAYSGDGENSLKTPTARVLLRNSRSPKKVTRTKFKRQMVAGDPQKIIGEFEEYKALFPMHAEINLPIGGDVEITKAMQDSLLAAALMRDLAEQDDSLQSESREEFSFGVEYFSTGAEKKFSSFAVNAKTLDLNDWWMYDAAVWGDTLPPALPSTSMFITKEPTTIEVETPWGQVVDQVTVQNKNVKAQLIIAGRKRNEEGYYNSSMIAAVAIPTLRGKIDNLIRQKARNFKEIIVGDSAYSETLIYKIAKHKGRRGNNPVQEFYTYNSSDVEEIITQDKMLSFIDTQVKYGKEYTYVVTAYRAIIGTKYKYMSLAAMEDLYVGNDHKIHGHFHVELEPTIKLVEIPIFKTSGKVLAPPPIPPEVNIISYKGVSNRMMFYFNTQVGETYEEPLAFDEGERKNNQQFLRNRKTAKDGEILYRTTAAISSVHVYRVPQRPENYEDFKDNLLMTVMTDVDIKTDLRAGSIGKIIKQKPNKKFYYMFRAVGFHGEVSNPSPVYEVELYNDGGVSYPIVRLVDLTPINPKTNTREVRNLLRITPRITQAMVNEEASGLIREDGTLGRALRNNIVLGVEDESLFGKRFKIRLTSKDTGKKIDLNVNFKTKAVRADE
jgi:hypothetical protein